MTPRFTLYSLGIIRDHPTAPCRPVHTPNKCASMPRPTVALLATYTLIDNTTLIKEKMGRAKSVTMIKASAYGHGIKDTALRLDHCVD